MVCCQVPPVECQPIDPPILAVRASVNDSPLAGKDGKYITLNALGERLDKEALTNPAIAPCCQTRLIVEQSHKGLV